MGNYKAPKLKLKKRKIEVEVESPEEDSSSMEESDLESPEMAKIPLNKRMKIKKKGSIEYRKGGSGKLNIIDARAITNESAKEMINKKRLNNEEELYRKLLKKMK